MFVVFTLAGPAMATAGSFEAQFEQHFGEA